MSIAQLMNALTLGALLTLLSSGLALIYGLRDIMNFAHGSIYMFAAFLTTSLVGPMGYWGAFIVVPLVCAAGGIVIEFGLFRPLVRLNSIAVALVTFALALVIRSLTLDAFGTTPLSVPTPAPFNGTISIAGDAYPAYRLFLIAVGLGTTLLLVAWLRFTRSGMHVRAVSAQPRTARMVGVNTGRLGAAVVCVGMAFAGLAGVLAAPYESVDPSMGDSVLVLCFVIVVLGGVGSIGGAIVAAIVVGAIQVLTGINFPIVSASAPYLLLILVLILRPQGIGKGRVSH